MPSFPSESENLSSSTPLAPWLKLSRLLAGCGVMGCLVASVLWWAGNADTAESSQNIFAYLLCAYDRWIFLIFSVLALILTRVLRATRGTPPAVRHPQLWIGILAAAVFAVCSIGVFAVFSNYPFSMDEYMADFQAAIFARGHLFQPLVPETRPIAWAATPVLTAFDPANLTWTSNYLPLYAALRTPFFMTGCSWMVNPLLAGLSVLAMAAVVRRLWPGENALPVVAAVLLAATPQFLLTGMTAYAMPAHLLLNLCWLLLYWHSSTRVQVLAPFLGVLIMGLHQPLVHVLFAIPFGIRLLRERRWKMAGWHAGVYAGGTAVWLMFMRLKMVPNLASPDLPPKTLLDTLLGIFKISAPDEMLQHLSMALLVPLWQSLALALFAGMAIWQWRTLPARLQDILAGLILPALVYSFFPEGQGHGWGNRYFFPYLGNLVLLGVAGYRWATQQEMPVRSVLIFSTATALLLMLPLRIWEARREVLPFAQASRFLRSLPAKIFIVETHSIWYGQDLVRNTPDLSGHPVFLRRNRVNDDVLEYCRQHPTVARVDYKILARFGLKPRPVPQSMQD